MGGRKRIRIQLLFQIQSNFLFTDFHHSNFTLVSCENKFDFDFFTEENNRSWSNKNHKNSLRFQNLNLTKIFLCNDKQRRIDDKDLDSKSVCSIASPI